VGAIDVSAGAGLSIVNVAESDVPPPGIGLVTVTFTRPPVAMSEAGTAAVSDVALTNVVGNGEPFQFTTEVVR
jgi:hypothetical protein